MFPALLLTVVVALFGPQLAHGLSTSSSKPARRPNFVFIMSDDQDVRLNSLAYQPLLDKHIRFEGTEFRNHYCTVSQCCPSRVSLLTGKAAHNTNVTDVRPPYGGYFKFIKEGWNEDYLPLWLQQAGYNTYYVGKLMNNHNTTNYNKPYPAGWNGTDFLIDPNTYQYYNGSFQRNQDPPVYRTGEYTTDLVAEKALGFIDEAHAAGEPFFVGIAPIGPHSTTEVLPDGPIFSLPLAAKRHENLFSNLTVPRTESFNPVDNTGVASWVKTLPQLNATEVAYGDLFYRRRLEALQAVDELVAAVVTRVADLGLLDDTYIFYTSDNGYHIGQHRLPPGKSCGFEEDILVPFFVRGPGVAKNATVAFPTTHTDIAPTLFQLAGIGLRGDFDGIPIPVREKDWTAAAAAGTGGATVGSKSGGAGTQRYEHVNVEFWGTSQGESPFAGADLLNNTYKLVRIVGQDYSLAYAVWCTNEHELYDLTTDPYQTRNLLHPSFSPNTTTAYNPSPASLPLDAPSLPALQARLDALLMVLKTCAGEACVQPWRVLHPAGDVHTLAQAMDARFDAFYEGQRNRVGFSACELGYLREAEGATGVLSWEEVGRWAELS